MVKYLAGWGNIGCRKEKVLSFGNIGFLEVRYERGLVSLRAAPRHGGADYLFGGTNVFLGEVQVIEAAAGRPFWSAADHRIFRKQKTTK
jgi:hypothetical protein